MTRVQLRAGRITALLAILAAGTFASVAFAANIDGTDRSDKLTGTNGADTINAKGGVDKVSAGGGMDIVDGGSETDLLKGEGGADTITGGAGFDSIDGGDGADTIEAVDGEADFVECGNGNNDVANVDDLDFVDDDCETVNVTITP